MPSTIIEKTQLATLSLVTGMTRYTGCQCFDCTCGEDFISEPYKYYEVRRTYSKTTPHNTLKEAKERFELVKNISNKHQREQFKIKGIELKTE